MSKFNVQTPVVQPVARLTRIAETRPPRSCERQSTLRRSAVGESKAAFTAKALPSVFVSRSHEQSQRTDASGCD